MGNYLVNILSENTDNFIYVTTRTKRTSQKENVNYIEGNAKNEMFLSKVLNKMIWDCVVDFMVYHTTEFQSRVNQILNSTKQYVFLSSSRVYADIETPITENSPRLLDISCDKKYLATDEYALTKARQENILFDTPQKNWTIIRPYITYSDQRLQLGVLEKEDWLYTALNCGVLCFSEDIARHRTTLTYGYDVARSIAAIILKERAYSRVFHITSSESIIWKDVYDLYSSILKKHNVKFEEIIKSQTYHISTERKYQVIYDRYYDRVFDNSNISEFIDITSFMTPAVGLEKCLENFLQSPSYRAINIDSIMRIIHHTNGNLSLKDVYGLKNVIKYFLYLFNLR